MDCQNFYFWALIKGYLIFCVSSLFMAVLIFYAKYKTWAPDQVFGGNFFIHYGSLCVLGTFSPINIIKASCHWDRFIRSGSEGRAPFFWSYYLFSYSFNLLHFG
jgi:hypothetical protein